MRRILSALVFAALFFLSSHSYAQEILSIRIPDTVKTAGDSFALSQIAEITGPASVTRTAGWVRFSTDGTKLTRDEVIRVLKESKIAGVKIELRMPSVVKIDSSAPRKTPTTNVEAVGKIQKGKRVRIVAGLNGIVIEAQGEAMQNGSIGDVIKVRNLSSQKIISCVIRTIDSVEVRI